MPRGLGFALKRMEESLCRKGLERVNFPACCSLNEQYLYVTRKIMVQRVWSSPCGSGLQIQLVSMRMRVRSLALLSGLRIRHYRELGCRLQMRLGSRIAVALA